MNSINKFALKIVLFSMICLAILSATVFAQGENKITVVIDNKEIVFEDANPVMIEDRVMVPFRKIFEIYGFKVDWAESTSTVLANKGNETIVLQINNKKAFVNNEHFDLDVPAQLVNDKTMVPLRFVSAHIGANVEWIDATNTVNITTAPAVK